MNDWISAVIPLAEGSCMPPWEQIAGATIYTRPGGILDRLVPNWLAVKGSYEHGVRVRFDSASMRLSGNPAKLLTGQNVDGPDDVPRLLQKMVGAVSAATMNAPSLAWSGARLTRVDITQSYQLGSIERVREVLRFFSLAGTARRQGRSHTSYQTVYFGQHSRRHSIKLYAKYDELREHGAEHLPYDVLLDLRDQAAGLLRVELCLRGLQLKQDGIELVAAWQDPDRSIEQWQRFWGRIEVSGMADLLDDEVLALPRRLRSTYELWRAGKDISELYSRPTYFRHRKELKELSAGKVDIGVLRPLQSTLALDTAGIMEYLRALPLWKSEGRLAEWIDKTAA